MTELVRTRALIADLAAAIGLPSLPPDENGGFRLTVGEGTDVFIYGGDDETILIVSPIGPLPQQPEYGLMFFLLRNNLFDSDSAPFQIAADEAGILVFWGRVDIADLTGATLSLLLDRIAQRVNEIRKEIGGEGPPG
jgi:hypothetical protein